MDLSQLPKMSDTPKPPPPAAPDARPLPPSPSRRLDYDLRPESGMGGISVWISLVMGVLCMLLGKPFAQWAIARLSGKPFATGVDWTAGPKAGQPVEYFELQGGTAWSDAALFTMGLALVIDALLMFVVYRNHQPKRSLVILALAVTGLALLLNVGVFVYLMSLGITPLMSLIAILIGGIMVFDHAPLLRTPVR